MIMGKKKKILMKGWAKYNNHPIVKAKGKDDTASIPAEPEAKKKAGVSTSKKKAKKAKKAKSESKW